MSCQVVQTIFSYLKESQPCFKKAGHYCVLMTQNWKGKWWWYYIETVIKINSMFYEALYVILCCLESVHLYWNTWYILYKVCNHSVLRRVRGSWLFVWDMICHEHWRTLSLWVYNNEHGTIKEFQYYIVLYSIKYCKL